VGSIRVESQEWWTPGTPAVSPPNIVGVATLIEYNDSARSQTTSAIAYNLLPEHKIYVWQIGGGLGGPFSGVALIAIPSLLKDLQGTGVTSELAITNVVPKPGFTDFAIYIYDQNGLLDFVCQKLNEKQVEYINLQTWGYVNPGFKGSAIISAMFWEHDVFDETGFFLRNLVGLAAVAVERTGTRLGEDVPGDEAAGDRGIPFREDDALSFDWEGPNAPNCPGGPFPPPVPQYCPASLTLVCVDCPKNVPQTGTSGPMNPSSVTVAAPDVCLIEDVDVMVSIQHTFVYDLAVKLSAPAGQATLFGPNLFCFGDPYRAILDDQATNPVLAGCGQSEPTLRVQTASGNALTNLNGKSPKGKWTLGIDDLYGGDSASSRPGA
jgi:hypothetical protein